MANWVNTTIRLHHGSEAAYSTFKALQEKITEIENSGNKPTRNDSFVVGFDLVFEEFNGLSYEETLGSRTINLRSHGDEIYMESAWSYPSPAVFHIAKLIMAVDPKAIISTKFIEESLAFVGFEVYTNYELVGDEEFTPEDLADDYDLEFDEDEGVDVETQERIDEILDNEIKDVVREILSDNEWVKFYFQIEPITV